MNQRQRYLLLSADHLHITFFSQKWLISQKCPFMHQQIQIVNATKSTAIQRVHQMLTWSLAVVAASMLASTPTSSATKTRTIRRIRTTIFYPGRVTKWTGTFPIFPVATITAITLVRAMLWSKMSWNCTAPVAIVPVGCQRSIFK